MILKVKNWDKYQHYKDRNPPWIKLHYEIMTSRDWVCLDDASRVLAVACMLIASRNNGEIPADKGYIKRVAYLNSEPDFEPLIRCGFLVLDDDASNLLADARPETETETYTEETETEKPLAPTSVESEPVLVFPLNKSGDTFAVFQSDIDQWHETFPAVDVIAELKRCRQWNIDNTKRRKTKFGIRNHISSWLGRVQDKGGNGGVGKTTTARSKRDEYDETRERFARELLDSGACSPGGQAVVNQIQGSPPGTG